MSEKKTKQSAGILDLFGCGGAAGYENCDDLPGWAEFEGLPASQASASAGNVDPLAQGMSNLQINQI